MTDLSNEAHSHVMIACCKAGSLTFQERSLLNCPIEISILFWSLVLVKTLTRFESSLGNILNRVNKSLTSVLLYEQAFLYSWMLCNQVYNLCQKTNGLTRVEIHPSVGCVSLH